MNLTKKQYTNITIHVLLWVAVFLFPFLFKPQDLTFSRLQLTGIYLNLIFTLVVFYLSYSIIIPLLFYKKRIVLTVAMILLSSFIASTLLGVARESVYTYYYHSNPDVRPGPGYGRRMMRRGNFMHPQRPFYDNFFFYLLVSGAALSIRATQRWIREEHDRKALEADNASLELAWLKNQVSPHFFFNTLNNIHSLIESNPEFAQKSVQMLSKLMRYLLYESNAKAIALKKEVVFIENYIGLMKLKLTENVDVSFIVSQVPDEANIPPLLFNPLIENAFKYGVSYEKESFIKIELAVKENRIQFSVENSIATGPPQEEHSGIGIKNLEQRLHLLYQSDYSLSVNEFADTYRVELNVPLYES